LASVGLWGEAPVAHKGRIRPVSSIGSLSLKELFTAKPPAYNPHQLLQYQLWNAGDTFRMLPSRYGKGEWISLKALSWPIGNFTIYSDEKFEKIRRAFLALEKNPSDKALQGNLLEKLETAYREIAGQVYLEGHHTQLSYPTERQLQAEAFYTHFPWIPLT